MNNLGTMYLYGVGLPRDYSNAFRWFERSAEHGNPHATYSVAVMADIGLGTGARSGARAGHVSQSSGVRLHACDGQVERRPRASIRRRSRPRRGVRVAPGRCCKPVFPKSFRSRCCPRSTRSEHALGPGRRDEAPRSRLAACRADQHPWSLRSTRSSKARGQQFIRICCSAARQCGNARPLAVLPGTPKLRVGEARCKA